MLEGGGVQMFQVSAVTTLCNDQLQLLSFRTTRYPFRTLFIPILFLPFPYHSLP